MKVRISSLGAMVRQAGGPGRPASRTKEMVAQKRRNEDSVMARTARIFPTVMFLGGVLLLPAARGQAPAPPPASPAPPPASPASPPASPAPAAATRPEFSELVGELPAPLPPSDAPALEGWEPEFLKTLPQPPDQPRSLFQPAPGPGPPPPDLERYFELDPLLDPPQWRQRPGWFTDYRFDIIHPHLFFGMVRSGVVAPNGQFALVAPGAANLNWTVAPRLEIGYRLPSGFGAFAFSDRFFQTGGAGPFSGPVGLTNRTSRLTVNYCDWDYISHEFTPWVTPQSNWTLEWRAGIRLANSWTDNLVDKPFGMAATSNRVFIQGDNNFQIGAGPHFGAQVERLDPETGIFLVTKFDIADTFSRIRHMFAFSSTDLNPDGTPVRGAFGQTFWNQVAILNFQVGAGWKPPQYPNIKFYVGYVYEFWFQMASNMTYTDPFTTLTGATRGAMDNQGIVLQVGVNY